MKRKVIQQSKQAYTITLPIKWIRERNVDAGDDLEVSILDNQLLIGADKKKGKKRSIVLKAKGNEESQVRTAIVNAYRSGYDIISLEFDGDKKWLKNAVDKTLLGFESFEKSKHLHVIESVSEPSYEQFEEMIGRSFFVLKQILKRLPEENIEDMVHKIQRYDNFLKRSISKELFTVKGATFLWQFLSNMTQIARASLHLQTHLRKNDMSINQKDMKSYEVLLDMIDTIQKSFLKKDHTILQELHETRHGMQNHFENKKNVDAIYVYHMINLSRLIFLSNSPLSGYLFEQN